jgi:hypothetical protein
MRLPNAAHETCPWRIREIAPDFTLEDAWALPVYGHARDFGTLLEKIASFDPAGAEFSARVLFRFREHLGRWFGLDRATTRVDRGRNDGAAAFPIPDTTNETSLADRLPSDLRDTAAGMRFDSLPFVPLYRTDVEFAAEASNQTMHGVIHLAWVDQGAGRYQGQMAIYVKPRGLLGKGYMALIKPFRLWVVYPALMRQIERVWKESAREPQRRPS